MIFTETIYQKITQLSYISTDEFSKEWLGQSRSYYSSNKARSIEASTSALVCLMNKLTDQQSIMSTRADHPLLLKTAIRYELIAKEVGKEIANRSIKLNIANSKVKNILYNIISELNDKANPSAPPIIIGF
jgi:hypothetical protein